MPWNFFARNKALAATAAALPTAIGAFLYHEHQVPSSFVTHEDPVTQGTSVPLLKAAAFIDAHGHEWEVQKSNMTASAANTGGKRGGMELEILKMKIPYVIKQPADVYAAYNADETAGDKRLYFSPVPHDGTTVTSNIHPLRLVAYLPNITPKQMSQHIIHRYLRRRWDKNYMAFDKAYVDDTLTHPELFAGVKEADDVVGTEASASNASTVTALRNLDKQQLAMGCGSDAHLTLMAMPPTLRTSIATDATSGGGKAIPAERLLGARNGFTPVYFAWARHCVGSAALEKVRLRPREFLYEMLVSHKGIDAVANVTAPEVDTKRGGWGRKKPSTADTTANPYHKAQLGDDDVYSVVYQSLPQCLLPSVTSVHIPPCPVDVSAPSTASAIVDAVKSANLDSASLMATRLHLAAKVLSVMPTLSFRTAPVQMHYQEFIVLPVWTDEDKARYLEYARTSGGSIRQDLPLITPPPRDPQTGVVPPCLGSLMFMTSCNDAQMPASMPKWIEKNLSMTVSTNAYGMLAEGIRTYEEGRKL